MIRVIALALLLCGAAAGAAEPQVHALSPAEKSAAIEAASRRPDADNPALLPAFPQDRRVHGEVGAMIGSGGARGIYGVVGVPLGDDGSATFAYSNTRQPGFYGQGPFGAGRYDRRGMTAGTSFGMSLQQPGW